jgi:hypothetical protein
MGGISLNLVFYSFRISGKKTIRVIKSRRMRWEGNIARMKETTGACRVLVGIPEGK